MSLFVLAVGIAHGVPATLVGSITRNRFAVVLASLGMSYVAFEFGGNQYLAFDLIGVGAGGFFGWFIATHATPTRQEFVESPSPEQTPVITLNDIHDQMWLRLLRDGAGTGLDSTQLQKRKEAFDQFFTIFTMGDCAGDLIAEEDWLEIGYLAQSTGRSFRDLYADVLRLSAGERQDAEEVIQRGLNNFDASFKKERDRIHAEKMAYLLELAKRSR